MKQSVRTQYITLSIMVAVLFLLVSLLPAQTRTNSSNPAQADKAVTKVGLVVMQKNTRAN